MEPPGGDVCKKMGLIMATVEKCFYFNNTNVMGFLCLLSKASESFHLLLTENSFFSYF